MEATPAFDSLGLGPPPLLQPPPPARKRPCPRLARARACRTAAGPHRRSLGRRPAATRKSLSAPALVQAGRIARHTGPRTSTCPDLPASVHTVAGSPQHPVQTRPGILQYIHRALLGWRRRRGRANQQSRMVWVRLAATPGGIRVVVADGAVRPGPGRELGQEVEVGRVLCALAAVRIRRLAPPRRLQQQELEDCGERHRGGRECASRTYWDSALARRRIRKLARANVRQDAGAGSIQWSDSIMRANAAVMLKISWMAEAVRIHGECARTWSSKDHSPANRSHCIDRRITIRIL